MFPSTVVYSKTYFTFPKQPKIMLCITAFVEFIKVFPQNLLFRLLAFSYFIKVALLSIYRHYTKIKFVYLRNISLLSLKAGVFRCSLSYHAWYLLYS